MKRKSKQMSQNEAMLDTLTAECKKPANVEKLYSAPLQRVINRGLQEELTAHLRFVAAREVGGISEGASLDTHGGASLDTHEMDFPYMPVRKF